jgi:hypothetical protein
VKRPYVKPTLETLPEYLIRKVREAPAAPTTDDAPPVQKVGT